MKNGFLQFLFFAAVSSLIISSYSAGPAHRINWDGTGASGTSGCNKTGGCHNATTSLHTVIELDSAGIAVSSYRPGGAYTIKVTATNNINDTLFPLAYFGFQIAAVLDSGSGAISATQAGVWGSLPAHVQNTPDSGSRHFPIIEHNTAIAAISGAGGAGTVYSESIPWTAPAAGAGSVRLFGVINVVTGYDLESLCFYQVASPLSITEAMSTGINELNGNLSGFAAYPTQMYDHIQLAFNLKEASAVSLALLSIDGRTIKTLMPQQPFGAGAFRLSFDISGLAPGIYLLNLKSGGESVVIKTLKE